MRTFALSRKPSKYKKGAVLSLIYVSFIIDTTFSHRFIKLLMTCITYQFSAERNWLKEPFFRYLKKIELIWTNGNRMVLDWSGEHNGCPSYCQLYSVFSQSSSSWRGPCDVLIKHDTLFLNEHKTRRGYCFWGWVITSDSTHIPQTTSDISNGFLFN